MDDTFKAAVAHILCNTMGAPITVTETNLLVKSERSIVYRCHLDDYPHTVIVRQATEAQHLEQLYNDWAGLEFLDDTQQATVSPGFFGGNFQHHFIIEEDCPGDPLDRILIRNDQQKAADALLSYVRSMARMHTHSMGKHAAYESIRNTLSPHKSSKQPDTRNIFDHVKQMVTPLGVSLQPLVLQDIDEVNTLLYHPGEFDAYTHGDPCPDNCTFHADRFRFYDFEMGGFRHALIDGVFARLHFVHARLAGRLPDYVLPELEYTYRAELAIGCDLAEDDFQYGQAFTAGCMYWGMVLFFSWHNLGKLLNEDIVWGNGTMRQRAILRCETIAAVSAQHRQFEALGEMFYDLAEALNKRWGMDSLPIYPVFAE